MHKHMKAVVVLFPGYLVSFEVDSSTRSKDFCAKIPTPGPAWLRGFFLFVKITDKFISLPEGDCASILFAILRNAISLVACSLWSFGRWQGRSLFQKIDGFIGRVPCGC